MSASFLYILAELSSMLFIPFFAGYDTFAVIYSTNKSIDYSI